MKFTSTIEPRIRILHDPRSPALAQRTADQEIEAIAEHCIAAHTLIAKHGSSAMQRMVDLLLFEVGTLLAERMAANDADDEAENFG